MPQSPPPNNDWSLWQLLDSAFPTGGFAHSGGVEAAWQHGLIRDGDDLRSFVRDGLRQAAHGSLPVALAVLRDRAAFDRWDAFLDTVLTNHVANRASRAQGRALLSGAAATFDRPALRDAHDGVRRERSPCHLAAAFGLAAGALAVADAVAARAYLFTVARGLVSGAVRIGVVGPMEGQHIQAGLAEEVAGCADLALSAPPGAVAQTSFMADLLQGTQDRLYSRLFQS